MAVMLIIAALGAITWAGLRVRQSPGLLQPASSTLPVAASFYPLADFAGQIGGDKVTVTNLTPAGAEPHDFDPSPQDIVKLENSKVFIYNGANLEAWVDKVLPELQKKEVIVVKASQDITLQPGSDPKEPVDPHIWLDPALASQEVAAIAAGFIEADPLNKTFYESNAQAYQKKLAALDEEFKQGLANCDRQDIITSHAAFGYLARHYHLAMTPIAGLSPDEEPAPARLAEIAQLAKQKHIAYIFFESLVSPRFSETIAHEIGAKTIDFNPLEGLTEEEIASGKDYITVQQENLDHLKIALGCK